MKIKISDYIANFFAKKKMLQIFGITGGGAMHLNNSFAKNKNLDFIFFHHEQSAAMAADAYYRKNQRPCVLHTTSGPGATNAITGVTGAWIDSIPMFVISGQVSTKDMIRHTKTRQIGVQEINIIDIVKPITKFSATIDDPEQIDIYLNKSYHSMFDSRPGPVWLDVPLDVQSKLIDTKKIKKFTKKNKNKKNKNTIVKTLEKNIIKSSRPIIVIGNGIHISKSERLFRIFLDKLNIPVISSWNASDIINSSHNLYVGRMGIFGDRASNFAIEGADLIIVLGSRLSVPQTGYKTKVFAQKVKKIIIDISRSELNKNKFSKVILKHQSDLNVFLKIANKYFEGRKTELEISSLAEERFHAVLATVTTSVSLELFLLGVPTIVYLDGNNFNLSPLRDEIGTNFVSCSRELNSVLMSSLPRQPMKTIGDTFWTDPAIPKWHSLLDY